MTRLSGGIHQGPSLLLRSLQRASPLVYPSRAASLEIGIDSRHVRRRHEELFRVNVERVLIVFFSVIAVRTAEIVLAVLDGISIVVESRRFIVLIFSQRQLGPTRDSISLT